MSAKKALVYVSKAEIYFDSKKLQELANSASAENKNYGITGYLFFLNGFFLQYLEGPTEKIDQLFLNISGDRRHTIVNHVADPKLKNFRYLGWSMRFVNRGELQELSMEDLIIALMKRFESSTFDDNEELHKRVWRLMDILSINQWKLTTS